MTEALWNFFQGTSELWHTVFLALTAFIETLFPPFPGDVLYIALSGLGSSAGMPVYLLVLPGFAGCVLATVILYNMGRSSGMEKLEGFVIKSSGRKSYTRAKEMLKKHGVWILLFSRFIPGIRSILVIAAASSGVNRPQALACASISALLWYAIMAGAGYLLGAELSSASAFMKQFTLVLSIAAAVAVLIGLAVMLRRLKGERQ